MQFTIGGMSTLVGTAPNIVFSAFMQETYGLEITMTDWMKLGVPVSACACCCMVFLNKGCLL